MNRIEIVASGTEIDRLIREGQHRIALKHLNHLLSEKIGREESVFIASLTRRLSRSDLGIGLLRSYVRPSARDVIKSTDQERAEYAACLIRLGALDEAQQLLDQVDSQVVPQSLLFRAFAHIARWDFVKSGEALTNFLKHDVATYDQLIAKVNLQVGQVFLGDFREAINNANEITKITRDQKLGLLHSNALELGALAAMQINEFKLAEEYLREGSVSLEGETIDSFFIKKANVLLGLYESNGSRKSLRTLDEISAEAKQSKFWEQWRDCDFHRCAVTKKLDRVLHLYTGTPYQHYRTRLLEITDLTEKDFPEKYRWNLGSKSISASAIDLEKLSRSQAWQLTLKSGQIQSRLFEFLISDHYRPRRTLEIFAALYPNEFYNPVSAPQRVHQAMSRLKKTLDKLALPLKVEERLGNFTLAPKENNRVCLIKTVQSPKPTKQYLQTSQSLRRSELFGNLKASSLRDWFSVSEFAETSQLSLRTASRILSAAYSNGEVRSKGNGRSRKYSFK